MNLNSCCWEEWSSPVLGDMDFGGHQYKVDYSTLYAALLMPAGLSPKRQVSGESNKNFHETPLATVD